MRIIRLALGVCVALLLSTSGPVFGQTMPGSGGGGCTVSNPCAVNQGGTGANIPTGTQANYPSTTTEINPGGGSSIMTNPSVYNLASPQNTTGTVDTKHFYFRQGGIPDIQGNITSITPTIGNGHNGNFTIEFIADTSKLQIKMAAFGTLDIEVDGNLVEEVGGGTGGNSGTAQAGAASSITLVSGASSSNGAYNQMYVYITSGTGAGQRQRITAYNGSTKVATVASAWTTNPDTTSVYVVSPSNVEFFAPNTNGTYFPTLQFSGETRPHYIKLTSYSDLVTSIGVDSNGVIWKPEIGFMPTMFIVGDSFGAAGNTSITQGYAPTICRNLNVNCVVSAIAGTGIVNPGSAFNYAQRIAPPTNSWNIAYGGAASGGSYTLTQNGITTGAILYSDGASSIQTKLNSAFGANQWAVIQSNDSSFCVYNYIIENVGTLTSSTLPLTINSSLTGTQQTSFVNQYTGDIGSLLPKDIHGNTLPFYILIQSSVNDVSSTGTLTAAATTMFSALQTRFPTATIIGTGVPAFQGPMTGTYLTEEADMEAAIAAGLPTINGSSAILPTFNSSTGAGYLNGTTNVSSPSGAAGINTDLDVYIDGIHPTPWGHYFLGSIWTQEFVDLVKNAQ
jgi:hypothetical protein